VTLEEIVIAVVRIVGSLPVLIWPFWGGLLAMIDDQSDLFMMNLLHLGGVRDYQTFDKYLDQVYLLCFLIVSLRWRGWERKVSVGLYAYRFVGFVAFEATSARWLLLLFPNFFESWFMLTAARHEFDLDRRLGETKLLAAGAGLVALKIFQEYAIHYGRWLDGFTAVDAVRSIWHWLTPF
jgi:hypothetical protein